MIALLSITISFFVIEIDVFRYILCYYETNLYYIFNSIIREPFIRILPNFWPPNAAGASYYGQRFRWRSGRPFRVDPFAVVAFSRSKGDYRLSPKY